MLLINWLQNSALLLCLCAIFGLAVGSFLNVVIYRLPIMVIETWKSECSSLLNLPTLEPDVKVFNLLYPRSHCPHCKKTISSWNNIPLLSFILQKGKCKNCGAKISWMYPFVELLTSLATVCVVFKFGLTIQTVFLLFLTWALIVAIFIDCKHYIIPDVISLGLIWLGLLANSNNIFTTPSDAIIGAASAYAFLWGIAYLFKFIRKVEGMGSGDFKLFAVFGAWFGIKFLPPIIILSSLLGTMVGLFLIWRRKLEFGKPMPFGPYIAIAGWIIIFWGQKILNWLLFGGV